jgi:hypothetical protein
MLVIACALLTMLPQAGLQEALESLEGMVDFYTHPLYSGKQDKSQHLLQVGSAGPVQERPEFSIE